MCLEIMWTILKRCLFFRTASKLIAFPDHFLPNCFQFLVLYTMYRLKPLCVEIVARIVSARLLISHIFFDERKKWLQLFRVDEIAATSVISVIYLHEYLIFAVFVWQHIKLITVIKSMKSVSDYCVPNVV